MGQEMVISSVSVKSCLVMAVTGMLGIVLFLFSSRGLRIKSLLLELIYFVSSIWSILSLCCSFIKSRGVFFFPVKKLKKGLLWSSLVLCVCVCAHMCICACMPGVGLSTQLQDNLPILWDSLLCFNPVGLPQFYASLVSKGQKSMRPTPNLTIKIFRKQTFVDLNKYRYILVPMFSVFVMS